MIKKLSYFLNKKQKLSVIILTILILFGALLETLGVAVILPIVQLMMDENAATHNIYVKIVAEITGITDIKQIFQVMMGIMIGIYVLKNSYLLLLTYIQSKFINKNQANTQGKMLSWYLNRPYEYFLYADVSVILRIIRSDVANVFTMLLDSMKMLTEIMVTVSICFFLVATDWKMALLLVILLGGLTFFVTKVLKKKIGKMGRENQNYIAKLTKWILKSMNGIKIVKVMQKEKYFSSNHKADLDKQARLNTKYAVLNSIPKLLLETTCISGILLYLMISIAGGADVSKMASIISAFAIAAFRVLPSVSRISTYLANLAYCEPSLNVIYNMIKKEGYSDMFTEKIEEGEPEDTLPICKQIILEGVTYAYPNTEKRILDKANMTIPIGKSIGIKGASGNGKTTVVDILLGLLDLQGGQIKCDAKDVLKNKREWLRSVGYIPQNVYLTDDSIRKNIAFGEEDDFINDERIWTVLEEAQMKEFVQQLPGGLETAVGEQGIRISGGQKQRLGIARALYNDPEILIFDEATSALDNDTETAIMDAIEQFKGKKTMIIIAHRLRTIEKCDLIYDVKDGKIVKEC